jgi:hypothetical protein
MAAQQRRSRSRSRRGPTGSRRTWVLGLGRSCTLCAGRPDALPNLFFRLYHAASRSGWLPPPSPWPSPRASSACAARPPRRAGSGRWVRTAPRRQPRQARREPERAGRALRSARRHLAFLMRASRRSANDARPHGWPHGARGGGAAPPPRAPAVADDARVLDHHRRAPRRSPGPLQPRARSPRTSTRSPVGPLRARLRASCWASRSVADDLGCSETRSTSGSRCPKGRCRARSAPTAGRAPRSSRSGSSTRKASASPPTTTTPSASASTTTASTPPSSAPARCWKRSIGWWAAATRSRSSGSTTSTPTSLPQGWALPASIATWRDQNVDRGSAD